MAEITTGVSAVTQAVANFANTTNMKIQTQGAGETRTQRIIEQMTAQAAAALKSGHGGVKLSPALLSAAVNLQTKHK